MPTPLSKHKTCLSPKQVLCFYYSMCDASITDERLISLEIKLSYLEDFTAKLQDSLVEQGRELELLRGEHRALQARFRELLDSLEDMPHTRPPHY